ncbi:MAG: histidine phosphatase family protein [Actinobacteria bacterium]|nr:MAG: histidine phosphatase family protein [Actinomycetota bacterium]
MAPRRAAARAARDLGIIEVVFETHSMTIDNETGIATGWLPGRLSETGRGLARSLGERRRDDGLAVVFTSDLARALETAEIAFGSSGIPVREDWRLRECNYGELNGRRVAEIDPSDCAGSRSPFPVERATATWSNASRASSTSSLWSSTAVESC